MAKASIECREVCAQGFSPVSKIQEKIFHSIGAFLPAGNETPKCAQLFFWKKKH